MAWRKRRGAWKSGAGILAGVSVACWVAAGFAQAPATSDEEVAKRQLESGRAFARQGNYTEALKDFRAVADTHPTSSVADDAWLEIAKYYLDVVADLKQASVAVDAILKNYPTSDSAPDAYVMAGRLALSRSHQAVDLDAALANFDRVPRLFPTAKAVPRSLLFASEALRYARRFEDALAELGRIEAEYPTDEAAPGAYLASGHVLLPLGDPISAMEELQRVRDRWPNSPEAPIALAHTTLLHRLYVRAKNGSAYALTPETGGPAKLENNVSAVTMSGKNAVYWANENGIGIVTPATADKAPSSVKPRGLTVDAAGALVAFDAGGLQPQNGKSIPLALPKQNGAVEPLKNLEAAVELSNGDWIVADDSEKVIHRFTRAGAYVGIFAQVRVSRLAVNALDEVAAIDREQKNIALFDATGKSVGRIPLKTTTYELQNPEDLTFDDFGHLYVLDRVSIAVFSPFAAQAPAAAPAAPAGAAARPPARGAADAPPPYRLLTLYAEPEKSPNAFRKATSFAVDRSGGVYLYDENAKRIMVYR
jgi:TolA-binding protein